MPSFPPTELVQSRYNPGHAHLELIYGVLCPASFIETDASQLGTFMKITKNAKNAIFQNNPIVICCLFSVMRLQLLRGYQHQT